MREKFITECVRFALQNATVLLQNATVITNCDDFITKYDSYYKIWRLLQIATLQPLTASGCHRTNVRLFSFSNDTVLRQTWKTWKNQCFLRQSGKTWKTQGILRKYFKFLENSGNSFEIDILINLFYFLATKNFKWHYSVFTLYTTAIAGFFCLHIYLVWVTDCCLKWPTLAVYFEMQ